MADVSSPLWDRRLSLPTFKSSSLPSFPRQMKLLLWAPAAVAVSSSFSHFQFQCLVLDSGPQRAGTLIFHLYISSTSSEKKKKNKPRNSFQESVTWHSRNVPEKLRLSMFKLKYLSGRTRGSITRRRNSILYICFPFRFPQIILSAFLKDLDWQMPLARRELILEAKVLLALWNSAHLWPSNWEIRRIRILNLTGMLSALHS